MDLEHLVFRSFSSPQDIARILTLAAQVEAADHTGVKLNEQVLHQQLTTPGHNPPKDRWVVENPGDPDCLVASALVKAIPETHIAEGNILVHPEWRRHGIGSELLSRMIERTHEQRVTALRIFADTRQPAAAIFLHKHGFTAQGAYTELRLAEGTRLPPVIWPYGYTMRTYAEVQNLATLTEAMNLSYITLWGHQEVHEDEMAAWLPGFNQQGLFLVFSEKGRVVGISRTEPSVERTANNGVPTGYIDAPGVVPQHRRLDLYRALVLTGIRWLYDQGQTIIEMESWGDKLEVLKMYRELGFKDLRQLVCYQLELTAGSDQSHGFST
jgi:mycothiol synthase